MLKLNTDEIRNLQFEVSIQGINYDELCGSLKFIIEDVEYGFPVKIQKDLVSVEVPPLEEIVLKGLKNGDIIECKLDIFGNGFYINPWGGQFELASPMKMEIKNFNVDNKRSDKKIVAELKQPKKEKKTTNKQKILEMMFEKLKQEGFKSKEPKQESIDKEEILEMLFEKLKQQGFKTTGYKEPEMLKSKPKVLTKKQPKKLTRKELTEQKINSKMSLLENLIKNVNSKNKTLLNESNNNILQKVHDLKNKNKTIVDESSDNINLYQKIQNLKNRTETVVKKINVDADDPIVLMESVGMKSPKMQQTMIKKAIELGGDGDTAIAQTLKQLLGITKPGGI